MELFPSGMIQVYTGNGKGKTTAAIGQVVRATGVGMKTFFAMFMKDYPYSEIKGLEWMPEYIDIKQYANDSFVMKKEYPSEELKTEAKRGLDECIKAMNSGKYNIVVMDEAIVSIFFKLIELDDLLEVIKQRPKNIELILTGRYCPDEIKELADLVTEMKEVKHYYQNGQEAREGFEC